MRRREERKQKVLETVVFIIGVIIFLFVVGRVGYFETHYEMECKVVKVKNNIITLEDSVGFRWEVENDSLTIDDKCIVTFFTNDTDNRLDDVIEKVEKR